MEELKSPTVDQLYHVISISNEDNDRLVSILQYPSILVSVYYLMFSTVLHTHVC